MDFTTQFLFMLLVLVLVCAGAVVSLRYVLPRFVGGGRLAKGNFFEVIAKQGIDFRRMLYVVRIGKRYFVLGGAEQGLNLITELKEEELGEIHGNRKP